MRVRVSLAAPKREDIGKHLVWPINKSDIDPYLSETAEILGLSKPENLRYNEKTFRDRGIK